jgi:hypothetical protein
LILIAGRSPFFLHNTQEFVTMDDEQRKKIIEDLKKSCLESIIPLIINDIEELCNSANDFNTICRLESIETALRQVRTW